MGSKEYKGRGMYKCAESECKFKEWADELEFGKPRPGPLKLRKVVPAVSQPTAKRKCGICLIADDTKNNYPKADRQRVKQTSKKNSK